MDQALLKLEVAIDPVLKGVIKDARVVAGHYQENIKVTPTDERPHVFRKTGKRWNMRT